MNHIPPIAEAPLRLEAGPSSNERLPFLPVEILGKIFSWLTPRARHILCQNLVEKQIDLISQLRQPRNRDLKTTSDLYATTILKKAVELGDHEAWKPFQGFIDKLATIVSEIGARPPKEELSSLLTKLTELNLNDARFEEKEADFFLALFNLTPLAFDRLCAYLGDEDPFIKEVAIYRNFQHELPRLETREKKFTDWIQADHFFPAHKIFPLLDPSRQSYCAANMILACCCENTITKIQGEELVFFAKKFTEIMDPNWREEEYALFQETLQWCLLLALKFFLNKGRLEEANEIDALFKRARDKYAFMAAQETIELYVKELEGEQVKQVVQHEKISAIEEKLLLIFKYLIDKELHWEVVRLIDSLSLIRNNRGMYVLSADLRSRISALFPPYRSPFECLLCTIL